MRITDCCTEFNRHLPLHRGARDGFRFLGAGFRPCSSRLAVTLVFDGRLGFCTRPFSRSSLFWAAVGLWVWFPRGALVVGVHHEEQLRG